MDNYNNPQPVRQDNGSTVALICYFTLIGWIIGLVLHSNNKTSLGAYHLRQMLGLMILIFVVMIIGFFPLAFMPFFGMVISMVLNIGILVFWILGLISAANGQEKPIPIVGELFQKWFAGFGV